MTIWPYAAQAAAMGLLWSCRQSKFVALWATDLCKAISYLSFPNANAGKTVGSFIPLRRGRSLWQARESVTSWKTRHFVLSQRHTVGRGKNKLTEGETRGGIWRHILLACAPVRSHVFNRDRAYSKYFNLNDTLGARFHRVRSRRCRNT